MNRIVISCKGDNCWREEFDNERHAIWFLVSLLSRDERRRNCLGGCSSFGGDVFDVEDDLMTWEEGDQKKYCAGWHWPEYQEAKQIKLGDKLLYNLFMELTEM